jgi:hypothetical protein
VKYEADVGECFLLLPGELGLSGGEVRFAMRYLCACGMYASELRREGWWCCCWAGGERCMAGLRAPAGTRPPRTLAGMCCSSSSSSSSLMGSVDWKSNRRLGEASLLSHGE